MFRQRVGVCLTAAFVFFYGCSFLVESDKVQCSSNLECADFFSGVADLVCLDSVCRSIKEQQPWACVDEIAPITELPDLIEMGLVVFRLVDQNKVEGASVRACRSADTQCLQPVAGPIETDSEGSVFFQVPSDFIGFIEINDGVHLPTLVMTQALDIYREGATTTRAVRTPVVTQQELGFLVTQAGVTADFENTGQLFIWVTDCRRELAENVVYDLGNTPSGIIQFYLVKTLPSTTATHTDTTGQGGYINTPPGFHTVTATVEDVGEISTITVLSRAGWVTIGNLSQKQ